MRQSGCHASPLTFHWMSHEAVDSVKDVASPLRIPFYVDSKASAAARSGGDRSPHRKPWLPRLLSICARGKMMSQLVDDFVVGDLLYGETCDREKYLTALDHKFFPGFDWNSLAARPVAPVTIDRLTNSYQLEKGLQKGKPWSDDYLAGTAVPADAQKFYAYAQKSRFTVPSCLSNRLLRRHHSSDRLHSGRCSFAASTCGHRRFATFGRLSGSHRVPGGQGLASTSAAEQEES